MRYSALWFAIGVACAAPVLHGQVDPSARYRTLHTPHFRVHFQPPHRNVAEAAAREAEQAYGLLAQHLTPPRGRIDVVLSDDLDLPNGIASVVPTNRITIFLPPPVTGGIADFDSWLRLVITHELVHIYHLDRSRGVWRLLQSVFGRAPGLFPNAYQPSWVVEGLATYYESHLTAAGRVGSSFHRQLLRGELLAGRMRRPNDATTVELRWPGGNAPYAYGARFFDHLARVEPPGALGAFVEATAGQVIPYRVGRQLWRTTGEPLARRWTEALEPLVVAEDHDGGGSAPPARVLAGGLLGAPGAARSPDGTRVAYVHDDGRTPRRIIVLDLASGTVRASHLVNGNPELVWNGDTLLVTQLDFTGLYQVRGDLYAWLPGSTSWRRITRRARVATPQAGGGRVVAIRITPLGREPVEVAADGTLIPLSVPAPEALWAEVIPTRDGRSFAGIRHAAGQWDIVVWSVEQPEAVRRVTADRAVEADLSWAPDGTLIFTSDASGLPQVHQWDPVSGGLVRLTDVRNGAREGDLGMDGVLLYATIEAEGHALIAGVPRSAPAAAAPTRPLPGPLPDLAARESGFNPWPSLAPRFWLPYGEAGEAGLFLGALTSGVDVLGRTGYTAALAADPDRGRWIGALSVSDARLGRPTLDVFAAQAWSDALDARTGAVLGVEERDGAVGATWLWRRWRWATRLRAAAEYERDRFEPPAYRDREYAGGSVFVGVARTVTPTLAVSRERGFEVSSLYRRRERLGSPGWSNEARIRGVLFLPGVLPLHVLALRGAWGATGGPDAGRFSVGGVSGSVVVPVAGIELGGTRTFPVRGYPSSTLRGTRAAIGTAEYRFPVAYVGRGVGNLPIGLTRLAGAGFGEVGVVWGSGRATIASVGMELAWDLTVAYDVPVRLRGGAAVPLRDAPAVAAGHPKAYLAIGSDF